MWEAAYDVDGLYGAVIVAPGRKTAEVAAFAVDTRVIDGAVNGIGGMVRRVGEAGRSIQTGYVRNYGVLFLGGALVVIAFLAGAGS
jgi:NADH-quinone oxidoreductase subunit L